MQLLFLLVALLAGLLSMPSSALAQTPPDAEPQRIPGWVFTPMLGVGGSWDDNVLLLHADENPPRDYGSPFQGSVGLDYTGRRTQFSTGYDGSFVLYRTLSELNSSHQVVRATLEHRPTARVTLFGHESFSAAPTTDALRFAGIPFYRIGSRTNSLGGGFEAALTKLTSLRTAYTLQSVDFDFDERLDHELRGGHAHQVAVGIGRTLTRRLTIDGEYSRQQAIIASRPDLTDVQDRFNIQLGTVTATYQLLRTLKISGGGGFARLVAGRTYPARTGPTLRAGVTHRARHFEASGSYLRSFIPSFGFGGTFENEDWSGSIHVPLARNRAYVNGSVSWMKADALEVGLPSLRSMWLSGTAGYRATAWLRVEGFYQRVQQDSERSPEIRARNQIGFQVVTAKPLRLR